MYRSNPIGLNNAEPIHSIFWPSMYFDREYRQNSSGAFALIGPYDREKSRKVMKTDKKIDARGHKRRCWWVGRVTRNGGGGVCSYVGVFCSEGSGEDVSDRKDSEVEVG
jgi:hypothetical protein